MQDNRQNSMPLVDTLQHYISEDCIRLHMPGHKGNSFFSWHSNCNCLAADVTEIPGLDDLHHPRGAISEAQTLLSELYGTSKSYFLINGTTVGIQALILSHAGEGEKVCLPRHSHRSVVGGLILSGATPRYLPSDVSEKYGMPLGVNKGYLQKNQNLLNDSELIFLQNPTFEGIAEEVIFDDDFAVTEKLAVDEAHGGHFFFHPHLPPSALSAGCQMVVHGAHKNLGSLTQTGFLHIGAGMAKERIERIENALSILQSTSPSYLLLASLDRTRHLLATGGYDFWEQILEKAANIRTRINKLKGLHCLKEGETGGRRFDPTKLVITSAELGINGYQLSEILRNDYKIQVEMAAERYVIAMLTAGDISLDEEVVVRAFEDISLRFGSSPGKWEREVSLPEIPPLRLTPRQAYFAAKTRVPINCAVGEISGETISPYPPGTPIICAGEEVTWEVVEYLQWMKKYNISRQGGGDPELNTLLVIK